MILEEVVEEISGYGILLQVSVNSVKNSLIIFQEYMIATPKPFVFFIEHHVMIMVSIIKGADLRTMERETSTKTTSILRVMISLRTFGQQLCIIRNN